MTYHYRISYGYGHQRAARIIAAPDAGAAIRDAIAGLPGARVFSVSLQCTADKRGGTPCQRFTTHSSGLCRGHMRLGRGATC